MQQNTMVGVDIGTTSTKVVAFSRTGEVIYQQTQEYPIISLEPGQAEQDPELVLQAALNTLGAVAKWLQEQGHMVEGVSFSSAMHSLILVDAAGKPLTNSYTWADSRSYTYADEIKSSAVGHKIYLQTGTPVHPMSPLVKLCWLRQEQPEVFKQAAKFIGIKEYVLHRLFGEYKVDYAIASATGLFHIFEFAWHPDALQVAGVSPDKLPEPVPPTHTFRGLQSADADALHLPADTPFVIGASDGCLANLASHAVRPGEAVVTIGTSGAVRMMANQPATDLQERVFSYILDKDHFVLGGAVNNGGVALRWFRDTFYAAETLEATRKEQDIYELLDEVAGSIKPGAEGLLFLPYLLGERAPIWDGAARACFIGAGYNHKRAHFLRAVMEGVIYSVNSVVQALEQTIGPVSCIYANGGFCFSELWVQMLADVTGKKVQLTETREGSAFGAAIMGMYALGLLPSLEAAESMIRVRRTFEPDQNTHETYARSYAIFESLYPKLKESFVQLSKV
ncbi:gluconate kinase (FGGY family) [Pontibacter mucosus]|uniref:Gluconate kinase (FGGY family) n=1 Tax=Pontibacter mucosus TaxID=1649266 RepID=A0A2T5YP78_9BACT|nr:gluconokinase [Pontibacter mucosus]PTX21104.1 gluconate kinase (FGGY family) [Pontibacter mucosus]